jgi:hypothetical protein
MSYHIATATICLKSPQLQDGGSQLGNVASTHDVCRQWLALVCDIFPLAPRQLGAMLQRDLELRAFFYQ